MNQEKRIYKLRNWVSLMFFQAIDHTFHWFTGEITHLGGRENTREACGQFDQ